MNDPQILFCDEPTGALNSKSSAEIMDLFSEIDREGTAVFLVTHDAKVAARTGRVLFLRDGKVVSEFRLPEYAGEGLDGRIEEVTRRMRAWGI